MTHDRFDRRTLLRGVSMIALGAAGLVASARSARAIGIESMSMSGSIGAAYLSRCGGDGEHASILAGLDARLAAESGASGAVLSASEVCPICGCPVTATRVVR